jgi:hypothetical protein
VIATDIFDAELCKERNRRWKAAFLDDRTNRSDQKNHKAVLVLEHLMQASDVCHAMQHWEIYCKWNENLFMEMYVAYRDGRSSSCPSNRWYRSELEFFDNFVIPLAKKLRECNVIGACADEYINNAMKNRHEWAERGEEIVSIMQEGYVNVDVAHKST